MSLWTPEFIIVVLFRRRSQQKMDTTQNAKQALEDSQQEHEVDE